MSFHLLRFAKNLRGLGLQSIGQAVQGADGGRFYTPLKLADVGEVQVAFKGEVLLGQGGFLSQLRNRFSQIYVEIIHLNALF